MRGNEIDRPLLCLLRDAQIPSYYIGNWFLSCRLESSVLLVPDRASGQSIAKLFGRELKAVMPGLQIKVDIAMKRQTPKPSAMKASWHRMQDKQQRLTEDQ